MPHAVSSSSFMAACLLLSAASGGASAAIHAELVQGNRLDVYISGGSDATLEVIDGYVKFNRLDPNTGPLLAADVQGIVTNVTGERTIADLRLMNPESFPNVSEPLTRIFCDECGVYLGAMDDLVVIISAWRLTLYLGAGNDLVEAQRAESYININGEGGHDSYLWGDPRSYSDSIGIGGFTWGNIWVDMGNANITSLADIEAIHLNFSGGYDQLTVNSAKWSTATELFVDPGRHEADLDFTEFTHKATVSVGDPTNRTTITAAPGADLTIEFRMDSREAPLHTNLRRVGDMIETTLSGAVEGSVNFDNAAEISLFASGGGGRLMAGDLEGASLRRLTAVGGGADDEFHVLLSPTVEFFLEGGPQQNADSLVVYQDQFNAADDGAGLITAPGAAAISYSGIESVSIAQGSTIPTPTPAPTPSPEGSVISALLDPTRNAAGQDRNGDLVVDSGDVVAEENTASDEWRVMSYEWRDTPSGEESRKSRPTTAGRGDRMNRITRTYRACLAGMETRWT